MPRIHSQSGVTAIDTTVASLLRLRHLTQLLPSLGIEQVLLKSVETMLVNFIVKRNPVRYLATADRQHAMVVETRLRSEKV
jgi:hypothetical protein